MYKWLILLSCTFSLCASYCDDPWPRYHDEHAPIHHYHDGYGDATATTSETFSPVHSSYSPGIESGVVYRDTGHVHQRNPARVDDQQLGDPQLDEADFRSIYDSPVPPASDAGFDLLDFLVRQWDLVYLSDPDRPSNRSRSNITVSSHIGKDGFIYDFVRAEANGSLPIMSLLMEFVDTAPPIDSTHPPLRNTNVQSGGRSSESNRETPSEPFLRLSLNLKDTNCTAQTLQMYRFTQVLLLLQLIIITLACTLLPSMKRQARAGADVHTSENKRSYKYVIEEGV